MMIKFITLYARDIHKTAKVYECLGANFDEEQHGEGPVHLACETNGQVLEIYPGLETSSRSALLGFEVTDLEQTKKNLENAGAVIIRDIAIVADALRLIASDPDGRELFVQEARQT
ncbi:VOC family protein [Roseibium sp.]|uniref:VOC family protein n=1 Tax=Roseibium sp. TaxID=1936156 RepID=UPI003BABB5C0